jgi:endoglycosylceramidase
MNRIYVKNTRFVDELGRERIFAGVNVVDKSDYAPGEQAFPWLNDEVLSLFEKHGLNVIRLGFTWSKLEPEPGVFNDEYLDSVSSVLDLCEKHGIYAFLDMHQDLFSSVTNGDGAPSWAVLTGGHKVTPTRFVWAEDYFWGKACHSSFDAFWSNTEVCGKGLQDHFAECWAYVAEKLGDKPAVIGFDFFNEPFPGSPGGQCFRRLVCGAAGQVLFGKDYHRLSLIKGLFSGDRAEKLYDSISYTVLHKATRRMEPIIARFDKIIFLENSYFSNLGIPYSAPALVLDGRRDPQQAFAPHAYDFMVDTPDYRYASNDRVGGIFAEHLRSGRRLGLPVLVGEWGGFGDESDTGWLRHIEFLLSLFDSNKWSYAYWHYNDNFFSSVLMQVYSRPYPKAVAGTAEYYGFDRQSGVFTLAFEQELPGETVIAAPKEVLSVNLDGEDHEYTLTGSDLTVSSTPGTHLLSVRFSV